MTEAKQYVSLYYPSPRKQEAAYAYVEVLRVLALSVLSYRKPGRSAAI